MHILALLKNARSTLADPKHWTKDANARNIDGITTSTRSPEAVCWCAIGALIKHRSADSLDLSIAVFWLDATISNDFTFASDLITFNDADQTTHTQVLQLFDTTIATYEEENK